MKGSNLCPVYKKGDKDNVCSVGKMFKKQYINMFSITPFQSRYLSDNLTFDQYTDMLRPVRRHRFLMLFCDISKAFKRYVIEVSLLNCTIIGSLVICTDSV